jgi:hypothetical protein
MGRCFRCEKKGFLIPINKTGLCGHCNFVLENETKTKLKTKLIIIYNSLKIIDKSKDTDTIVSVTIIALFHLKELLIDETKEIESATGNDEIRHPIYDLITKVIQATNEKLICLLTEEYKLLRSFGSDISRNVFLVKANNLKPFILKDDLPEIDRMISDIRDKKLPLVKHSFLSELFSFHLIKLIGTTDTDR